MWGNRSGTEPRTARSPLGLRAILSGVTLPLAMAVGVAFIVAGNSTGAGIWYAEAAVAFAVALIAATDLMVIRHRARRRSHQDQPPPP
ncbi:hypothetical protein Skr01_57770 [Sphaerisporangium krabiense]|uniref:Uncharacterized protein n=1 Tax=Sphaerisporangium krabiense TaxID=763782 RepID=A0A7W8Z9C9_9ACTN|nr:DUF6343 family protein [Sphaerisporangium krabiense]MBB5629458.1 hypothetical protein [Sphaerisporangium krabiense]GII65692.1 hypothetical protein Skr01_57770 [Sphaerisporangium krabiense]